MKAFGLDKLSGPLPTIVMDGIKFEFSVKIQNQWDKLARPEGEVDLLIGSEVAHLHPTHMETAGKMVVKLVETDALCKRGNVTIHLLKIKYVLKVIITLATIIN